MKKTLFIYSGEGTHSSDSQFKLLKHSAKWGEIEEILDTQLDLNLVQMWEREIRTHRCPYSPLLTVISQICLSDIWQQWGYSPDVVVGHSTGELAAAYQAGLYTLEETLRLALNIGNAASRLDGEMIHGILSEQEIKDLTVNLSSFNFKVNNDKHVTISGYPGEIEGYLLKHPDFVKLKLPHPWHHPDYRQFLDQVDSTTSRKIAEGVFVSGVTAGFETELKEDHWKRWMVNLIDFIQTIEAIKDRYDSYEFEIIEIGFHPVLEKCCRVFGNYTYVSSLYRGEDDIEWILYQRRKLSQDAFLKQLKAAVFAFKPQLDFDTPLAYQGFDSLEFVKLADLLHPFFPTVAPQDFYRYKTIHQLISQFGQARQIEAKGTGGFQKEEVVIAGMSCRFPSSVETLIQFWEMLISKQDQVKLEPGRGGSEAGYLNHSITRFDHQYFNIPSAEARAMDPQQILALELTEMLWRDAAIDPETLDKSRIGVYIGAWSQEYQGDRTSVYYPTGTNPSIIAARISHQYDFRGPSWVSNTACSSSLVAIHYAAKDIEAGRVDYAIAGGVNMLLDEKFTENMRNSGFLSQDNRCKAFDNSANGYVRAEGGGLILLVNKKFADRYYATLLGSAINQNGRRSQLITAPHPDAQEELILAACHDGGIKPQDISYVECHGTGTKIGDPIEISALQNTIAKNRTGAFYIGSIKSNIGHLESAAGIAGLIKSVAILNYGVIPPNLQFNQPNQYIDFESHGIKVVTEETKIDRQSSIGISSFGFGGSNAHIIVKGAEASVRKAIKPMQVPFDRERASVLESYIRIIEKAGLEAEVVHADSSESNDEQISRETIDKMVGNLFFELTNVKEIDPDVEMTDQGLDSMSGTELITQLETTFNIDIDPDVLFEFPLRDQFVDEVYALVVGGGLKSNAA